MAAVTDQYAIGQKLVAPQTRYDVIVVGAGRSGAAAAIEAAQTGKSVLLIDENPVSGALMGNDVPLYFGGRMTSAVQNSDRMVEVIVTNSPALETAIEAGVDVMLGTTSWGIYRKGPMPEQVVALADKDHSWTVGFGHMILATGTRDLSMAFPGWDQPGVMGAVALRSLLTRYDAFAGQSIVIVGSHDLALETALLATARGIAVMSIVEVRDAPQGRADLIDDVIAAGIPVHCNLVPRLATGGIDGVNCVTLSDGSKIACDTICMAIGAIPAIELYDAVGGALALSPQRGGYIAGSDITSDATISFVGSCAGVADVGFDHISYRMDWARALATICTPGTIVCQCEAVTRDDIIGVQPPHYLDRSTAIAARSLGTLLNDGPPNQDQIKRLTRAGMGSCQGRRCRDQVAMMLAIEADQPFATIPLATHRAPVRPVALGVIADIEESTEMGEGWDVWFGIPTQWTPYRDIGTEREDQHRKALGGNMHL